MKNRKNQIITRHLSRKNIRRRKHPTYTKMNMAMERFLGEHYPKDNT